jgi:PHAX RNA-binding domain
MNHEATQETNPTVSTELTEPRDGTENAEKSPKQKKPIDDEEMQQFISTIASWLEETEETPLWYLRKIVRKAGTEQTMALLKEVLEIEQQGGMLIEDQSRRRTVGGVFFYLAKQKGYLKQKFYPQQKHGQPQYPATTSEPSPTTQPAWNWEDRLVEIAKLRKEQGATNVKITLIGRPGRIVNHGAFVLTTMQSTKVPALPKGLPVPPQGHTTFSVYIASKQWKKVEESLRNPEDILIAEGYPVVDAQTGTIAVFVSSTATKLLQAAQREQLKAKA